MGLKHLLPFLSLCFFCHSFTPSTICFPALPNRKGERTKIIPGVALPPGQLRRKKTKKKTTPHSFRFYFLSTVRHLRDQRFKRNVVSSDSSPLLYGRTLQWTNRSVPSLRVAAGQSERPVTTRLPSHCAVCFTERAVFFLTLCFLSEKSCGRQTQPDFCCLSARDSDWLITIKRLQS